MMGKKRVVAVMRESGEGRKENTVPSWLVFDWYLSKCGAPERYARSCGGTIVCGEDEMIQ